MGRGSDTRQLQELREAIDGLSVPVTGEAIAEARELLDALEARVARAEATWSAQGQAEIEGYADTAAFFRNRCATTPTGSRALARRARRLTAWSELAEAWADGRVTGAQVELACRIVPDRHVERFAASLSATVAVLAPLTAQHTARVLRRWCDCADDAAEREAAEDGRTDRPAVPERELSAPRGWAGEMVLRGHLDPDSAAPVEQALLAATTDDLPDQPRTPTQRRADALVEICRTYLETVHDPDANRRRDRLTVVADVTTLYRAWLRGAGVRTADELDDFLADRPRLGDIDRGLFLDAFDGTGTAPATLAGHPVTESLVAATARGGVLELLLTAQGRPLHLGRSARTFSPAQRRAVLATWQGCATCGAPPERCDVHHVQPWEEGGVTDVANAVPKCRRCHLDHHRKRWPDRLEPDGTYVLRPAHGPERRHRPPGPATGHPRLPVATTARPAPPVARPAPSPEAAPHAEAEADRCDPTDLHHAPDPPEVQRLHADVVYARLRYGSEHPLTEQLRTELFRLLDHLDQAA